MQKVGNSPALKNRVNSATVETSNAGLLGQELLYNIVNVIIIPLSVFAAPFIPQPGYTDNHILN
ncbi:MAG: hypothetical protein M3250_05070 [Thermoproteota archaeon]|nr:hypothetical protein [Thermoproteota archaeon]